MKLDKDQLGALSGYILEEIKKSSTKATLSKIEEKEINDTFKELKRIDKEIKDLRNRQKETFLGLSKKYYGNSSTAYAYYESTTDEAFRQEAIKKKGKALPSLQKIREELILMSMMKDDKESIQSCIAELVKKYSK